MANYIQFTAASPQSSLSRQWISNYYQSPNSIGNIVTQSFEDLMANGYGDDGSTIMNDYFLRHLQIRVSLQNQSGETIYSCREFYNFTDIDPSKQQG